MVTRLPCRYDIEAGNQQLRHSQPSIFCYFSLVLEHMEGIARELDSSVTRRNPIPTPACFTVSSFTRFFFLHSTLYTLNSTLYPILSTLYTLHSMPYALHSTPCPLHSTLYALLSTLYAVRSTLYALRYSVICAL